MIIKQQNETAEYEARLEKLNKAIKNKNELLQKKQNWKDFCNFRG